MIPALDEMSLLLVVLIFCAAGAMIVFVGTRFTGTVDTLADRAGLGEAITGAVFMGATTSIPDIRRGLPEGDDRPVPLPRRGGRRHRSFHRAVDRRADALPHRTSRSNFPSDRLDC
ncbi:MAG: hypothetical protein ACOC3I_08150 [Verrucomicrobiota bacterium]